MKAAPTLNERLLAFAGELKNFAQECKEQGSELTEIFKQVHQGLAADQSRGLRKIVANVKRLIKTNDANPLLGPARELEEKGQALLAEYQNKTLSAAHVAAHKGCAALTQWLILSGAPLDARALGKDNAGMRPLHFACQQKQLSVARLLLESGKVEVDAKGPQGRTPLHYAACGVVGKQQNPHVARLLAVSLLAAGANPRLRDDELSRPAQIPTTHAKTQAVYPWQRLERSLRIRIYVMLGPESVSGLGSANRGFRAQVIDDLDWALSKGLTTTSI